MLEQSEYFDFLNQIKQRIASAQYEALKSVNKQRIRLYWDIGRMIVEKQQQLGWGKSVVEQLARDLQNSFPGQRGWSTHNLWRMRKFYLTYADNPNLAPLVQEISWTHNVVIMEKCKDNLEREFYIRMTRKYGWSKNVLIHQIEGNAYALYLTSQTNFDKTLEEKYKDQAILAVKDEYVFDFLDCGINQPIGVATYQLTSKLPKDYEGLLPSPQQIAESLKIID